MSKFNSLIIGMGNIGYKYDNELNSSFNLTHLSSQQALKKIKKIYCFDSKKFKINKKNKIVKVIGNLKNMKNIKIDLVTISTPTNTHYQIFNQLLSFLSPKIILLEKPGTLKAQNFSKLLIKCKKKGIILFCNYYRNFDLYFREIFKYIDKKYNEIIIKYSGDIYLNLPHFISYLNLFAEGKYKINILKKKISKNKNVDILIEYKNCKVHILQNQRGINEIYIDNKKYLISSSENFNRFIIQKKEKSKVFKNINYVNKSILIPNKNLRKYQKKVYDKIFKNLKNKKFINQFNQNDHKTLKILNTIEKKLYDIY